jgi:hypothetical protein
MTLSINFGLADHQSARRPRDACGVILMGRGCEGGGCKTSLYTNHLRWSDVQASTLGCI